jgi:hypothetical protein
MQEKEKEVLMKEQEENYHKFRQLLDYDDVCTDNFRVDLVQSGLIVCHNFRPTGSELSTIQPVHPSRISNHVAFKTLLGVDLLVDERNCEFQ